MRRAPLPSTPQSILLNEHGPLSLHRSVASKTLATCQNIRRRVREQLRDSGANGNVVAASRRFSVLINFSLRDSGETNPGQEVRGRSASVGTARANKV